jgi:hypothetical protein
MYDCTRAGGRTFWFATLDTGVGLSLRNTGEFAAIEVELLIELHRSRSCDAFIDVGANIGSIALPIEAALPETKVFAFDAHPELHGLLMTNIVCNAAVNIIGRHCAIGDYDGVAEFPTPALNQRGNFGASGFSLPTCHFRPS